MFCVEMAISVLSSLCDNSKETEQCLSLHLVVLGFNAVQLSKSKVLW